MSLSQSFEEIVNTRRAVRKFHESDYNPESVTQSLRRAQLAPSSSNMQLWEFYRISDKEQLAKLATICMSQNTASTAKEAIVVVARPDLWRKRAAANLENVKRVHGDRPSFRGQSALDYYGKLMPLLYNNDALGIRGLFKKIYVSILGLKKPMVRQVTNTDIRIVAHKSAALASQTFMLSMVAEGHDTCPVEGFDSVRLKDFLNLPSKAEVTMVITCGKRIPEGIYGERFRVPASDVVINK
jgi:nitroreductase